MFNGDIMDVDNILKTTTKGTQQNTDIEVDEMIILANKLCVEIIEMLLDIAPVDVYVTDGNHDKILSIQLREFLRAYYRANKCVKINNGLMCRQIYTVNDGKTLIIQAHNLTTKQIDQILMDEARKYLSKSKQVLIYLGHLHHRYEDKGNYTIMRLGNIAEYSHWEFENGFKGKKELILNVINKDNEIDTFSVGK